MCLTACGGSDGGTSSSAAPTVDAQTRLVAPSYELEGNQLRVTNSGISDADGVTDLMYVLLNSAGQEVARQTSPRFADLAAGSYTLKTEGRAKNGATGASVAVINAKSASVVVLSPVIDTPAELKAPTVAIDTDGKITALSTNSSDADGYKVESYTINGQTVSVGTLLPLAPTTQTVTVVENGQAYNPATKSWMPTSVSTQLGVPAIREVINIDDVTYTTPIDDDGGFAELVIPVPQATSNVPGAKITQTVKRVIIDDERRIRQAPVIRDGAIIVRINTNN